MLDHSRNGSNQGEIDVNSLEAIGKKSLLCRQTKFGAFDFELFLGDDLIGRMYWPKWLSDEAVATCADGDYLINRLGFFAHRAVMLDMETEREVATVNIKWLGDCEITFHDGRTFQLFQTKAFCEHWVLSDENDETVIEIKPGTHWFKYVVEIDLHAKSGQTAAAPSLIMLCWYLIFMNTQDAAAAVVASSVACV
jgi:hypothetical protein